MPRVSNDRFARAVTEPRRLQSGWECGDNGLYWVLTAEEIMNPVFLPPGRNAATIATPRTPGRDRNPWRLDSDNYRFPLCPPER
jgi:hypothetical protein